MTGFGRFGRGRLGGGRLRSGVCSAAAAVWFGQLSSFCQVGQGRFVFPQEYRVKSFNYRESSGSDVWTPQRALGDCSGLSAGSWQDPLESVALPGPSQG